MSSTTFRNAASRACGLLLCGSLGVACGAGGGGGTRSDSGPGVDMDAGFFIGDAGPVLEVGPNPDAFFATDPPPQYCGPTGGGGEPPPIPGGTPECPDDKNREGCPCTNVGETAPCWPGLRVDRGRGQCRDGVTTCEPYIEFFGRWGACNGYVLPEEGVTLGRGACNCFSAGRWALTNTSPCVVSFTSGGERSVYFYSSYIGGDGRAACRDSGDTPPPPLPDEAWSENTLTVDCAGQFELCYTLKAGDADAPSGDDCTIAQVCTSAWYGEPGVEQAFPPLPAFVSSDTECGARFVDSGGYGEMSVLGTSIECDAVSDGGERYVYNRVKYCAAICGTEPSRPECASCGMGGSGTF